jgi:hypothetical protein
MTQAEDAEERSVRRMVDVRQSARAALESLLQDPDLSRFADPTLHIPGVFHGEGEIRLILLGQDPTVKNARSRKRITTVLNLDKPGRLRDYLCDICEGLGLNLEQHLYATNYLKNFFVKPPTQIEEIDIFEVFGPIWLPLLHEELASFPQAPVITLGQPLLGALVCGEASPLVRNHWGYTPRWKSGERGPFRILAPQDNSLERTVFPFPHQPSIRKQFYRDRLADYTAFVKQEAFSPRE